jgi:hypothetical protein
MSSAQNRAIEYLAAFGTVPISVTERGTIHAGGKITGTVAGRWWLNARNATRVAREARRFAGANPDASTATAALQRAAGSLGATLTPDDVAIGRAGDAIARLDALIETLRRNGTLREFNAAYKSRRAAAVAPGKGYMAFHVAMGG